MKRLKQVMILLLSVFLLLLPVIFKSAYIQRVAINCGIYIMLASSLNILIGYLGLFSLGHAAFYCIGAYTAALLSTRLHVPFPVCLVAAGIMAGTFGGLIGACTLRLNDIFLAFTTLGFSEVVRILIQNWVSFTGGPMGVAGIPRPKLFGKAFDNVMYYYLVLVCVVAVLSLIRKLVNSNTGRTLLSIREDENAARSLGINVFRYKLTAMIISCFLAGVAGAVYAHFLQFISATTFSITESTNMVAMVAIGGMGTIAGPVIGAVILTVIPEVFRFLSEYRQLMYGVVMVIAIVFAPGGVVGLPWKKLLKKEGE